MILTLIKTLTASDSASLAFVDGTSSVVLDNTYDEYMFVFTDIAPANDGASFQFQVNATDDAGGGYDTSLITSSSFDASHSESGDSPRALSYQAAHDSAQSSSYSTLANDCGSASDESIAGIMHLFSPSSTTYVKHFYSRFQIYGSGTPKNDDKFTAGYINDTTAIDEISFKFDGGNFDGVIQLFGVA
jgi:hypothetical protein